MRGLDSYLSSTVYPAVTVERIAPLASVADGTANWCQSSGLCWVVLLDGHTQGVARMSELRGDNMDTAWAHTLRA